MAHTQHRELGEERKTFWPPMKNIVAIIVNVGWYRIEGNANILQIEQFELQKDTSTKDGRADAGVREKFCALTNTFRSRILNGRTRVQHLHSCIPTYCVQREIRSEREFVALNQFDATISRVRFPLFDSSCPRNFCQSTIETCHLFLSITMLYCRRACVRHSDHIRFRTGFIGKRKTPNGKQRTKKESTASSFHFCYIELGVSKCSFHYFPPINSFRFYSLVFHVSDSVCFNVVRQYRPFS